KEAEAVIICVPTPLNKNREPDLSYVLETGRAIAPYLKSGEADLEMQPLKKLIVLESTTYPGTTEEELRAVLEENSPFVEPDGQPTTDDRQRPTEDRIQTSQVSGQLSVVSGQRRGARRMRAGVDFHLAFSPEREDPGNELSKVKRIPKVVGGYTPVCLERAVALYSRAIDTIIPVSSCRAAEATKLLENIFRSVNIALVNELKLVYGAMGIDVWEVIDAAKTKPFGFMPFYPGPGLGSHCIPIDPFYLTWKAREHGQHTRFIELAGEINTKMPEHVVHCVSDALNSQRKTING